MEPIERLEQLAALVPVPRGHLLWCHGTPAPYSRWRSGIVPKAPGSVRVRLATGSCGQLAESTPFGN